MLRKDLFFFGASVGFRTVCEEVSFEVGNEFEFDVGDSEGAVVESVGPGFWEESEHCRVRKGVQKHTHDNGVTPRLVLEMRIDLE